MEDMDIYARLTQIFHDVFDDESITVSPRLTAAEVEDWDSLNHIRLVLAVQKSFGVKFSAAETANLKNVGDLATLVRAKTAAK